MLFPLLGLTNVCFFIQPNNREPEVAYRITNAALQSVQASGINFSFELSFKRSAQLSVTFHGIGTFKILFAGYFCVCDLLLYE